MLVHTGDTKQLSSAYSRTFLVLLIVKEEKAEETLVDPITNQADYVRFK